MLNKTVKIKNSSVKVTGFSDDLQTYQAIDLNSGENKEYKMEFIPKMCN